MSFVDAASRFQASVTVSRGDQAVDGKSIMQMLMLAATKGTVLRVTAEGADADEAIKALSALVNSRFGED